MIAEHIIPTLPVTKTNALHDSDLSIVFKGRTVVWDVDDNNHSVDRARSSPLGQAFFRLLGKVKWTRGTGGYIQYRNEYMEWDGPQIKERCGPIGERTSPW